ncbi:MAG: T9SS type A sorting domain-containing protein [Chitinophagales bacterium]
MKKIFTLILIITGTSLFAQNELYISGDNTINAASPDVYVDGKDGTNPTLFVAGDVINNQGQFHNVIGEIELTGDFTNTADGTNAKYESTGIERFSGNTNSTVFGTMNGILLVNNFYDLKLDKDAVADRLNLAVNTNVRNILDFESNGIIRTDVSSNGDNGSSYANELYILNSAGTSTTITGGATGANEGDNYIEGKLRHQINGANTYFLPIGIEPGSVDAGTQPVNLVFTAADNTDIVAFFEPQTQGLNNSGVVYYDVGEDPTAGTVDNLDDCAGTADGILDRLNLDINQGYQWQVNNGGAGTTFDYSVTVHPSSGADITATNAGTYGCNNVMLRYLAKNGNVGGDGVTILPGTPDWPGVAGYQVAPTGNTISSQTSFSTFRLHSVAPSSVTLPVELLSLSADGIADQYIQVDWATASEIDNNGFELQRSKDGENFETISWIEGSGTTTAIQNYRYDDKNVEQNVVYYYRLNQIDFNGDYEHSNIVAAKINEKREFDVLIYPNPSKDADLITMQVNSSIEDEALIQVYSVQGKIITTTNVDLQKGQNSFSLDNSQLAPGNYFVKIATKENTHSEHITIYK